jgi:hypothetical protein
LKHFGSIHKAELKWKPSGCEVAMMEAFVVQVAPYVNRELLRFALLQLKHISGCFILCA